MGKLFLLTSLILRSRQHSRLYVGMDLDSSKNAFVFVLRISLIYNEEKRYALRYITEMNGSIDERRLLMVAEASWDSPDTNRCHVA